MTTVLGLDVGGTYSRARLVRDGHAVADATGPSASLTSGGRERAGQVISGLLDQVGIDTQAGPGTTCVDAVCVGTAGSGAEAARTFLVALLSPLARGGRLVVVNDALLVLAAAGLTDGIACVAGTGSIAVGILGGREERCGGWGYLLGDEGSGYWVVREAVRELAGRNDAHVPLGPLGEAVLDAARCADVTALVQAWHDQPAPLVWAGLAPTVLACGDPFGDAVIRNAADALAMSVASVHARLGAPEGFAVVLAGGLLTSQRSLAAMVRSAVEALVSGAKVSLATEPPVAGAVALALAAALRD